MNKLFPALAVWLTLCVTALAQGGMMPGPGTAHSTAAAYQGPGDVTGYSGAYAYWGLRGYNAAYSTGSNPAIDVVDQSQANLTTINITSTGNLDLTALSAWVTAHSVTRIGVRKIYDQSGHSLHVIAPTTQEPQLILSGVGLGSKPSIAFDGGSSNSPTLSSTATAALLNQPFTISAVARFNTFAAPGGVFGDNFSVQVANNGANAPYQYAGTVVNGTITDGQFIAIQSVFSGASSYFNLANAGTNPTGAAGSNTNPGAAGIASGDVLTIGGLAANSTILNGYVFEVMIIPNAVLNTNQPGQVANQRLYGGF